MPPSHSTCASSPRAAGVNSALSADSRSSRSNARYWASNRADWASNNSALVTVTYLAQIPASRNLDNPCTLRAEIRDARRLQDAAVECRGYQAVVGAVSHKLRHAATRRSDGTRPFGVLRAVADALAERVLPYPAWKPGRERPAHGRRRSEGCAAVLRHWRERGHAAITFGRIRMICDPSS